MPWPQDAYVGQKIICVDNSEVDDYLIKGNEYTVAKVGICLGETGLELIEVQVNGHYKEGCDTTWYARRFRPIQSTSTGFALLRALLNPANHRHREDA